MKTEGMTYGEWYQTVEKPRLAAITPEQREANAHSHWIGNVDDTARCTKCEVAAWNSWQVYCPVAT